MARKKLATKKILIVEDEQFLSEMYREVFLNAGFIVATAPTGKSALKSAVEMRPDLILLDILMPDGNGIYFLQEQAKNKNIADIPVVAFSNLDDPKLKEEALLLGTKEYLLKTEYTPRELVAKINAYLI